MSKQEIIDTIMSENPYIKLDDIADARILANHTRDRFNKSMCIVAVSPDAFAVWPLSEALSNEIETVEVFKGAESVDNAFTKLETAVEKLLGHQKAQEKMKAVNSNELIRLIIGLMITRSGTDELVFKEEEIDAFMANSTAGFNISANDDALSVKSFEKESFH